jgi:hypothetical protein
MLNTSIEEVETQIYVPDTNRLNTYQPAKVIKDKSALEFYSRHAKDARCGSNGEGFMHCWVPVGDNSDGIILEDLTFTRFNDAYFCNIFTNPNHPTLSDFESYSVGDPEMLKFEDDANAGARSALSFVGETVVNTDACPSFSKISRVCAPKGKVMYLNGAVFRSEHIDDLRTVFGTVKVGYGDILQRIKSYRVTVRTSVTPNHFKDYDPKPIPYPDEVEFDKYFSAWKRYDALHGSTVSDAPNSEPLDFGAIPKVVSKPLITRAELDYCEQRDIRLPKRILSSTLRIDAEIKRKRQDILDEVNPGELNPAPKVKRYKKDPPPVVTKSNNINNYFKPSTEKK